MQIHFYAQASFLITSDEGLRIAIDPYEQNERFRYDATFDEADILLVTHEHGDHNNVDAVPGDPQVVRGAGLHEVAGTDVSFKGIASYHDQQQGQQRGPNTIFVFDVDGITVAHLGDQGCELEPDQIEQLSGVQVMIAPVGGGLTLDPDLIWKLAEQVNPNVFIPCHFKTPEIDLPIGPLDDFLVGKPNVEQTGQSSISLSADSLPDPITIKVLERSR